MNALADRILKTTTMYLGPAAGVFLERQAKGHLGGLVFGDVREEHLPKLLYWIKASGELLIQDKAGVLVGQLMRELKVAQLQR
jgi:hypothetical protein